MTGGIADARVDASSRASGEAARDVLGCHAPWTSFRCGLVTLATPLAVVFFGFGVVPWVILVRAFCVRMMGSMVWMVVAMERNAIHRH